MSEIPFGQNHYAAGGVGPTAFAQAAVPRGLPLYCVVIFAMDIAFSLLRLALVGVATVAMLFWPELPAPEMAKTAAYELLIGVAMVIFGLIGDIAMLLKQQWGLLFGWLKALSVAASVLVGVWQLHLTVRELPDNSPEQIGAYFGGALVMVVRLCLLGLFVAALIVFGRWSRQRVVLSAESPPKQW